MPYVRIETNRPLPGAEQQRELLGRVSHIVSDATGKPSGIVMTRLEPSAEMTFRDVSEPCAFIEFRGIGLPDAEGSGKLCAELSSAVAGALDVPLERVFLNLTDVPRAHWGLGGKLLG